MSPVSRGRKRKNKGKGTRPAVLWSGEPEPCDCPACTTLELDGPVLDSLIAGGADLFDAEDPIDAELFGAGMTAVGGADPVAFGEALVEGLIPDIEARSGAGAVALLAALGSVSDEPVTRAAWLAADRLIESGSPKPGWVDDLRAPVTATECWVFEPGEGDTVLAALFRRAGRSHGVVIAVDEFDCGEASEIFLVDGEGIPRMLAMIESEHSREPLDSAEFRWRVEAALDARAVHDEEDAAAGKEPVEINEDGPPYAVLAAIVRARMKALPAPDKPKPPHSEADPGPVMPRPKPPKLLKKRTKAAGPAPVYQLKVGLRGAKPPIWRRLEVPADIPLPRLHQVIQIAFDWDDSHLHVFETPFGDFGNADPEVGHQSSRSVTLEQVAPGAGSKLGYLYDFGDAWDHEIVVEKVLEPGKAGTLPRCTGGRRAAPPEDCGGMWGYADLLEILADPTHADHADRIDWLGLDEAADFDAAAFSASEVNEGLSGLR
ncbi:pRiA4b ORF-3-like protein [Actinokineospora alba]|uniref:PRiA4b ORF-3-like protein n=1 Tax=Actinokineospora alba TaxID=504798 RepID=A0A1H0WJS2_9PSEU|nr:plasmid pRiA4b ORF-3 family protein [Actinokineospora alba]TDP65429.1 pRiA4b ORF-3-like protein [Actinokineospora alba]SDH62019.1 pRiA4b ORF-3-like protein [Actinokineospora alba]SDP90999.1 pRiA4b ORF-3-like protein [Actinokineospora alba]